MFNLPNILTACNLLCGLIAIIFAFTGRLDLASLCLLMAMAFDFLDGLAARQLDLSSAIGKDLDSLADMISFGVAPGILMFITIALRLHGDVHTVLGKIQHLNFQSPEDSLALCALCIPVFSAFRLAKFNNDTRQKMHFFGLPTPANTLFFLFFPLMWWHLGYQDHGIQREIIPWFLNPWGLAGTCVLFPLLLISEIPLLSLKIKGYGIRENVMQYLLLGISLITILCVQIYAIPIIVLLYLVLSVIKHNLYKSDEI